MCLRVCAEEEEGIYLDEGADGCSPILDFVRFEDHSVDLHAMLVALPDSTFELEGVTLPGSLSYSLSFSSHAHTLLTLLVFVCLFVRSECDKQIETECIPKSSPDLSILVKNRRYCYPLTLALISSFHPSSRGIIL